MKLASTTALLLLAASHVLGMSHAHARGHNGNGGSGHQHSGGQKFSGQQMQTMPRFNTNTNVMKGNQFQQTFKGNSPVTNNITRFPVKNDIQVAPRSPGFPVKPIDLGIGNGKTPIIKHPIDVGVGKDKPVIRNPIDFGVGKGTTLPPIDLGIGKKPVINVPVDLGIGKKPTINPPIDLGIGKGNGKMPLNPDLVDKLKGAIDPGFNKPKIPICPPYPFPKHPPIGCKPCPSIFWGWCWFPGYGNCYGYTGGVCLPTVLTETVVLEMPVGEALPQVVPGTKVVAQVAGNGPEMGRVLMQYGNLALPVEVMQWEMGKVTFVVPSLAVKDPTAVKFHFLRSDGELAQSVDCELVAVMLQQ